MTILQLEKDKAVDTFFLRAKVDGLSPKTIRNYTYVLSSLQAFIGSPNVSGVSSNDLRTYLFHLKDKGLTPATLATHQRYLKAFYGFLVTEGLLDKNPMLAVAKVK